MLQSMRLLCCLNSLVVMNLMRVTDEVGLAFIGRIFVGAGLDQVIRA